MHGLIAGDKPELLYPEAARELAELGCGSTLEYVAQAAGAVLAETGLLPHVNAGVMGLATVLLSPWFQHIKNTYTVKIPLQSNSKMSRHPSIS